MPAAKTQAHGNPSTSKKGKGPIFFWSHNVGDDRYLSQWWPGEFTGQPLKFEKLEGNDEVTITPVDVPEMKFDCAEQWMMYHKAMHFDDTKTAAKFMKSNDPAVQKALAKKIKGFSDEEWDKVKLQAVIEGS